MLVSLQRRIALLLLFFFVVNSSIAQERKIEFDDGTSMSFEMLKQDPTKPIPLYIGFELGGHFFASESPLNATYGLNGFYFLNPDLILAGKAGFGLTTLGISLDGEDNGFDFINLELGAYYTFAKKVKVKNGKLNLKSVSTGYKETTNYVMKIKEPRQRSWEAYLGIGSTNLPGGEYYSFENLQSQGIDGLTNLTVLGQSITTLEVGISTRKFTRNVFSLEGKVRGQSVNSRWTAKLMLPLMTRVSVEEGVNDFFGNTIREIKEDVDYFDDQWSSLGFGIFYQIISNSAMTNLNFNGGYSIGLAMYPFMEATPCLSLGYTLGFGLNDPKQLID